MPRFSSFRDFFHPVLIECVGCLRLGATVDSVYSSGDADEEEARDLIPLRPRAPRCGGLWGFPQGLYACPTSRCPALHGAAGRWASSTGYFAAKSAAKRRECVVGASAARCTARRNARRSTGPGTCWMPANATSTAARARSATRRGNRSTAGVAPQRGNRKK